jgi:hypothetical protein
MRAAIQRILARAPDACSKADFKRAAKSLDLLVEGQIAVEADDEVAMLIDVALFEPNQRGNRVFDRFVSAGNLREEDDALARRMAGDVFTALQVNEPHEAGGLWCTDLLNDKRRIWLMDEGLSASARIGSGLFMRLFDAGPFHAGFGIIVPCSDEGTHALLTAERPRDLLPNTRRLAPFIYRQETLSRDMAALDRGLDELLGPGA